MHVNLDHPQLLEEHTRQSMRRVELALSLAAQEVQEPAPAAGVVHQTWGKRLQAYLPQDRLIASFAVLDAQGQVLASTLTEEVRDIPSAGGLDFVQAHRQIPDKTLFIGAMVQSPISGNWIIPVSIRLTGDSGAYLMGAVDPAYFQRLYQSIDTGPNGFVTLFNRQGWALARAPFSAEIAARNWIEAPLFKEHLPLRATGTVRQKLATNGVDSLYSYRALREYPLVVALGMPLTETLVPWRKRVLFEGLGLALVLLFLGLCTALVMAQLRRRMQAEAALQLSEISVLKSTLPTLWIGPDARILRVNRAACDLHGYTEAQMLRMTVLDLNPGMRQELWPAHWQRLRDARSLRFETTHRTGDGRDVPMEAELNFIEFEGREYNFAFMRDLTVRKQIEAEIQRSGAMLRDAMDAVDEAFVLFDANDTLVYCNEKYAQLYPTMQDLVVPGARFEDLIREGTQRGLYSDSVGREEEWIAERLRAHREGDETRIQKRDNGRVLRVIDRRTPDGNIVGIRVDITDMVRATEEAQEASRYKSQFLANMSHEIRTPMNAILGLLSLLQKTELNPVQRDYADKTQGAAQSLLGLLNDILDFSKVEAGKLELDPQPLRLERLLADMAVILSPGMGNKPIEMLFDIDAQVPAVVLVDAMRLQQVLVNLLGNAIKFTEVGQVVLGIRSVPPAHSAGAAWLEFAVTDSGIGIAPDKQEHVFSGFSQAEASTTRRFGGTGLGLAICKRLVELMGGTLVLHSAPGQGSTFRFALPLPVVDQAEQLPDAGTKPLRVLVVDDNPIARAVVCKQVQAWGWHADSAVDGEQALAWLHMQAQAGRPPALDVVYLDWQMPGMDGWDTARHLLALYAGQAQQPRIVMLSAHSRDTLNVRTAEEQALVFDLLHKPMTPGALRDAALGRRVSNARSRQTRRSSRRPLAGMRVLVVEDNLINQQVAEELLNAEGALVSLAANGQLGVDAVQASQPPFDVVLMDIQMPVLDGYGATRKIREELGLQSLPIVAMTANAMASDRAACLAAGMNEHVGKPFDMRHLVAVLLEVTGRDALADGLPSDFGALQAAAHTDPLAGTPAQALPFSSPYLDVATALDRISGMTLLYVGITRDFLRELDGLEAQYRALVQRADWPALLIAMHTLKGTAATLGANPLSEQAARLEKLFRSPAPDGAPLDQLPALLELVRCTHLAATQAIAVLSADDAENTEAAVAPHVAASPQQCREASAFLQELAALLARNDLTALERFAQEPGLLQALEPQRLEALQNALQDLDLAAAHQLCEEGIAALASTPS